MPGQQGEPHGCTGSVASRSPALRPGSGIAPFDLRGRGRPRRRRFGLRGRGGQYDRRTRGGPVAAVVPVLLRPGRARLRPDPSGVERPTGSPARRGRDLAREHRGSLPGHPSLRSGASRSSSRVCGSRLRTRSTTLALGAHPGGPWDLRSARVRGGRAPARAPVQGARCGDPLAGDPRIHGGRRAPPHRSVRRSRSGGGPTLDRSGLFRPGALGRRPETTLGVSVKRFASDVVGALGIRGDPELDRDPWANGEAPGGARQPPQS